MLSVVTLIALLALLVEMTDENVAIAFIELAIEGGTRRSIVVHTYMNGQD